MNETERAALVSSMKDEIEAEVRIVYQQGGHQYAVITEDAVEFLVDMVESRVTAAPEPGLDELLDSVHPKATIDTLITYDDGTWAVTIVHPIKPTGSYGQSLTSEILAYNGTGPTRMDAIRSVVAQATQEGTSNE